MILQVINLMIIFRQLLVLIGIPIPKRISIKHARVKPNLVIKGLIVSLYIVLLKTFFSK